jgi:hypothetical protein
MTNEIEDETLWPDARLAQARAEVDAEEARRAAVRAESKQASLTPQERELQSMREYGKADADETLKVRRRLMTELGFDVGWK